MKTSKIKSLLAITVCAIIMAALIALPTLIYKASDMTADGRHTTFRPERAEGLDAAGMANKTARALYIDHAYSADSPGNRSLEAATQYEFDQLKMAGVIPDFCSVLTDDTAVEGGCRVFVEPVSGVAVSIFWSGEGVESDGLFEGYIGFLGLSGTLDWQPVEYKGPYMSETTLGRYSPSLQLYVSAQVDDYGKACGIDLSSHTKAEMQPLLEQLGQGEGQ